MHRYARVEIEWLDATHYPFDRTADEIRNGCGLKTVRTLGFLVERSRGLIKIAGEYIGDETFRDTTSIARKSVTRITYLRGNKCH